MPTRLSLWPTHGSAPSRARPSVLVMAGVMLVGTASPGWAQGATDVRSDSGIVISLVTVGPGLLPWERFGHNGVWVRDPRTGLDSIYDYGRFAFDQENFVLNFIQGRMEYWMASVDASRFLRFYASRNRDIWIQALDLAPDRARLVRDFLLDNDTDENRYYRYDYYYDNCSTRVRDVIDLAVGERFRAATDTVLTGTTFRFHTQRLTTGDIPLYTGLLIGLGQPVDREITRWEEMFLPEKVMSYLRTVTVPDADGNPRPVIKSERQYSESTFPPPDTAPPAWLWGYLGVGLLLAAALWMLGTRTTQGRAMRTGFAVLAGGWMLIVGVAGTVIFGLWAFTDHATSYWNENLFFLNPLALGLAVVAPFAAFRVEWARVPGAWLGAVVAGLSVLGLLVQVLPGVDQVNGQVIALILPANVVLSMMWRWHPSATDQTPT